MWNYSVHELENKGDTLAVFITAGDVAYYLRVKYNYYTNGKEVLRMLRNSFDKTAFIKRGNVVLVIKKLKY